MQGVFADIVVAVLAALLIVAAVGDLRTRRIPNSLNAAIALGAIPFWFLTGMSVWPDMALQLGIAAGVLALFAIAFQLRAMGGGDVKLLAAISLWLPPAAILKLLVIMSLAGGVLTIVMVLRHRPRRAASKVQVPYGVAIAFAGLWLISERYLYQFG